MTQTMQCSYATPSHRETKQRKEKGTMEMVPVPSSRDRQRRRLSRQYPAVFDSLLPDESTKHSRRARPKFGDSYNLPLAVNSSYQPPNLVNVEEKEKIFDNYLYFEGPPDRKSRSAIRQRRVGLSKHANESNPAVDMANDCFSYGCCCMQCVRTQEVGIMENFGQFQAIVAPGLYCLPWPLSSIAGRLSLRVQQLDVLCETKTKDNVFVNVQVSVQLRILVEKSFDAYYRLSDPGTQIRSFSYDTIRSTIPQMTIEEAFASKSTIADTIMERLFVCMREYGYEILAALVTNLSPDEKVQAAMNEIEASKRLKQAIPHQAEAEKIRVVKSAEAYAEAMYLSGVGIAKERIALAKGIQESIKSLQEDSKQADAASVMHLLLVNQYLDTLAAVKPDQVIVKATPKEVFDIQVSLQY